jgi:hypothetical protein
MVKWRIAGIAESVEEAVEVLFDYCSGISMERLQETKEPHSKY